MPSDALSLEQVAAMRRVLAEVEAERARQHAKWGEQNHPDGTGGDFRGARTTAQNMCAFAFEKGRGTFQHILSEEVFEALAESDPAKLRAELLQVAAVAVQWCEAIDRRSSPPARVTEDSEVAR